MRLSSTPAFYDFLSRLERRTCFRWAVARSLHKARMISGAGFERRQLALLEGWPRKRLESAGNDFARTVLLNRLIPKVMAKWRRHQEAGDRCVIVSRALDVFLQPFAKALQADALICCELAYESDVCLGVLAGPAVAGQMKADLIAERIGIFDGAECFAYGDSEPDEPMLRMARHRYVVGARIPAWAANAGCELIHPS